MQSFNVAGQGPFSVMIEEISSRNGILPLSNVHLLSVTDLLQRKDCCCYKREDQLKKKDQPCTIRTVNLFKSNHKHSQLLVVWRFWVPSSSSARELQAFFSELLIVLILHCHNCSKVLSLSLQRPQNLTWENSLNLLIVLYFFCSLRAPVLCTFTLSGSLVSFCNLFFLFCCSFIRTQAQSLFRDWVGEGNIWSKTCISFLCCKDWVGAPSPDQN